MSVQMWAGQEVPFVLWISLAGWAQLGTQMWVKLGCLKGQLVMHEQDETTLVVAGKVVEGCFEHLPLNCH